MNIIEKIGMGTKPDPYKFKVLLTETYGEYTVILARYEGCTTFNGEKLILFKGTVKNRQTLDPHFFEDHPVLARFIPNYIGWKLARFCAKILRGES